MTVGEKIKIYLEERGIRQSYISKKTGISEQKMSMSLNGKRKLELEEYEFICGALSVPVGTFLEPKIRN